MEDKENNPKVTASWMACRVLLPHLTFDHVPAFRHLHPISTSLITFVITHSVATLFRIHSSSRSHAIIYLYSVKILSLIIFRRYPHCEEHTLLVSVSYKLFFLHYHGSHFPSTTPGSRYRCHWSQLLYHLRHHRFPSRCNMSRLGRSLAKIPQETCSSRIANSIQYHRSICNCGITHWLSPNLSKSPCGPSRIPQATFGQFETVRSSHSDTLREHATPGRNNEPVILEVEKSPSIQGRPG